MDTFMDKFAQRKKAQGMIEANAAADAANMEKLKRQVNEYELLLQEMRKVNLKTAENAGLMSKAIQAGIEKIEIFQADNAAYAEQAKSLSEIREQLEILLPEVQKQEEAQKRAEALLMRTSDQQEAFSKELKDQMGALLGELRNQQEAFSGELKDQIGTLSGEVKNQLEVLAGEVKDQTGTLSGEVRNQLGVLAGEVKDQTGTLSREVRNQQEALSGELKNQQEALLGELRNQQEALLGELRNQQKALSGEMKAQMEAFLPTLKKQVEEASKQSEDFLHKESVKVYRNVQAAMMEELNKQSDTLIALQKESGRKLKAVLPVTIIILLMLLADIAIHLFNFTLF